MGRTESATALEVAISKSNIEGGAMLVEGKAEVTRLSKDGWSPMHIAVIESTPEMVAALEGHKHDVVDAVNTDGYTPIMLAAEKGLDKHLLKLVELKCNIDAKN